MDTIITGSAPLLLEARELRDKLAMTTGNEKLLAKLDDLLEKQSLTSPEQAKLINLIEAAKNVT